MTRRQDRIWRGRAGTAAAMTIALLSVSAAAYGGTPSQEQSRPPAAGPEARAHQKPTPASVAWAWGRNGSAQLGNGTSIGTSSPTAVSGSHGFITIAAGITAAYAVRADGTVWAWGDNGNGQLGDGTTTQASTPVRVGGLTDAKGVAGGRSSGYAVLGDGAVWAWGANSSGQLGTGDNTFHPSPVRVGGLGGATAVAAGEFSAYALLGDGTVRAWGVNYLGQLGDGTTTNSTSPVQVAGLTDVIAIAAGQNSGYALRSDGTVWAWGSDFNGQLGDGNTMTESTTPVQVSGLTAVAAIGAGSSSGYAVRRDGTVWAWGANYSGQLGDGSTSDAPTPVRVAGLRGATTVAAGVGTAYALRRDGSVWAWGADLFGELGNGSDSDSDTDGGSPVPVRITGLADVRAVAAGWNSGYALTNSARPSARLRVAPAGGGNPLAIIADASGSAVGSAPIASYRFDVGDGAATGPRPAPTAPHTYAGAGTFTLSVVVTDVAGARSRATTAVAVPGTPGIASASTGGSYLCSHCAGAVITSTGTAPLVISDVAPAEDSYAGIFLNTCGGALAVGESCEIGWTALPGPPGTNANVAVHSNAPGGVLVI